ncbi:hypothetical protein HPGAM_04830 [Helicobacter pylori Gambia94/24]|nr:hypothetical protein HPGAM_04830 [Helicobacter pylori Gambia94/24]
MGCFSTICCKGLTLSVGGFLVMMRFLTFKDFCKDF